MSVERGRCSVLGCTESPDRFWVEAGNMNRGWALCPRHRVLEPTPHRGGLELNISTSDAMDRYIEARFWRDLLDRVDAETAGATGTPAE